MEDYVFVCIGTNQLIEDSFGPRVGEILKHNFKYYTNIQVFGTMQEPVHRYTAPIFWDYLKQKKNNIILIDSAIGKKEQIGNSYIGLGGIEIGKAFGKSFYFPARLNIKTIIGDGKDIKATHIKKLARELADTISEGVREIGTHTYVNKTANGQEE